MLAGYALDSLIGDQRRYHPVAGFGTAVNAWERLVYAPDLRRGAMFAGVAVAAPTVLAALAARGVAGRPLSRFVLTALTTWTVLGGRSLRRAGRQMASALERGDLMAARERLGHICRRDPRDCLPPELARATIESVSENTSDAVVAPLFWGAVAGVPGMVAYRAINTLDAMVGHRSARYRRFGTAAARLDDVANLLPSRLTALLTTGAATAVGGRAARTWRVWREYGDRHPSPNSGQCEAAFAGALDVRLGGKDIDLGERTVRPALGDGREPEATDVRRAARLNAVVGAGALGLAIGLRVVLARRNRGRSTGRPRGR